MLFTILLLTLGFLPDDWYTFETESKVFRVALPTRPDITTSRSVAGPSGPIQLSTAQVQTTDGVYSVQITENSARVNPNTLEEGIRRFAASRKATLGPLRSVTVGSNPGREFEMTEGVKRSKVRFVASGGKLFVLSAAGMPGSGLPAEADRFLGSLEIGAVNVAAAEAKIKADADAAEKAGKAKMEAEVAKAKMEAEVAKAKMEAEVAKAKMEVEIARSRADAEIARSKTKAKAESDKSKAVTDFADKPDSSMTVAEAEKGDDDSKEPATKSVAKKSNAPIKVTIARMPKNAKPYDDSEIENLSRSFARDRDGFRDLGPEGSVLVGVRVTYIERFGGQKVRSVQPIYRLDKNHYAGLTYGEPMGPVLTVVARPGYAVGGLVTHTGLTVDGFGIVFMKMDGDRLDPNDTYNSPWIGDRKGGSPGEVMSTGGLVVGLQGKAKNEVNALGLTAKK